MDALSSAWRLEEYLVDRATKHGVPLGGTLELLPLCNMNCDMCYVRLSREEMEARGRLRGANEWLRLAEEMKQNGVLFLLLTGGEPLLHPDFKEIYLGLLKLGMIVTINTNGTLIDWEWARFFGKHKPRRINITLYGKDETAYMSLCHYRDGFVRTAEAVRLLRTQGVDIKLNGSMTQMNRADARALVRIAKDWEVPITVDTYMYPAVRERDRDYDWGVRLTPSQAAETKLEIMQEMLSEEGYRNYCQNRMEQGFCRVEGTEHCGVRCRAGRSSFVINWQGRMTPCLIMSWIEEDVFERGFAEAWKRIREQVAGIRVSGQCMACEHRNICPSCAVSAYLETGQTDGVPEYLCEYTKELMEGLKRGREQSERA